MKPDKAPIKPYLQKIRRDLLHKQTLCPAESIVIEYVAQRLPDKAMEDIRSHVAVCDYCIERVRQIAGAGDSTAAETLITSKIVQEDWKRFEKRISKKKNPWSQAASMLRLAAAIVFVILGGVGGLYLTRPSYYPLARVDSKDELRGIETFRSQFALSQEIYTLKMREFDRAIEQFSKYVDENSDSFEGHYYLGMSLLLKAESGLYGLFRFRQIQVIKAIDHLQKALSFADNNARQLANCFWFLGKAYLMQGEITKAKIELEKILALTEPNMKRKQEAEQLLEKMETLRENDIR